MPFAQWHAPFEGEEVFARALPRRLHLRGPRPDAGLVLLTARRLHAPVRALALRDRALPRPHPRSRGPEDVEEPGQRGGALGRDRAPRRRRLPLVLLHLEAALGRLPLLARDGGRGRPAVPAPALEHLRLPRPVRERQRGRSAGGEPRERSDLDRLGALAAAGARWRSSASASTTTTPRRAGRAIADLVENLSNWYVRRSRRRFWDGDPAAFATLRACLVTVASCWPRSPPSWPTRSTRTSTGPSPPSTCATSPSRRTRRCATEDLERADGGGARCRRAGPRRPLPGQGEGPPAPRARPSSWRPTRGAGGHRALRRARARRAQREGAALRVRGRRARPLRSSRPTTAPWGRASARACPRWPRPCARSIPPTPPGPCARAAGWRSASTAPTTRSALTTSQLVLQPLEGYQLERSGTHAVALNLEQDDALRREGLAREVVHAVQDARKGAGLRRGGPRSTCASAATSGLLEAVRAHEGYVTGETLATSLEYDGAEGAALAEVGGRRLLVRLERAGYGTATSRRWSSRPQGGAGGLGGSVWFPWGDPAGRPARGEAPLGLVLAHPFATGSASARAARSDVERVVGRTGSPRRAPSAPQPHDARDASPRPRARC